MLFENSNDVSFVPFFGRGGPKEAIVKESKNMVSESWGGPFPEFRRYGIRARGSVVLIFSKNKVQFIKSERAEVNRRRVFDNGGAWHMGDVGGGGVHSLDW